MIQDIAPEIFHNEYTPRNPQAEDVLFFFRSTDRGILLADRDGEIAFPLCREVFPDWFAAGEGEDPANYCRYLFSITPDPDRADTVQNFYLWNLDNAEEAAAFLLQRGYSFEPIRTLRKDRPQDLCFAGTTAYHLYVWYDLNRFCGRCGQPTVLSEKERALICPSCGNTIYPRIVPAVIVGLTDGDRILMTRYAGRGYKGHALIAGFCEIGERAEETVRREVMEEVGLTASNIRYFDSQPWGFESDLLLGYYADVEGNDAIRLDENELSEAVWVSREDIEPEESPISLTATMIEAFRRGEVQGKKRTFS
ncbi:MAG: NAD(+) diphosphatase [Lachnospiraceae bacterium]|nr:NAD(+) diphosphatase [Lachnospiraceae bacterium]